MCIRDRIVKVRQLLVFGTQIIHKERIDNLHDIRHTGVMLSLIHIYNIEAEKDGKVTAICVKPGQAVLEEDALVVIE